MNVSSQASLVALSGHISYGSSKAALDNITRVAALELGKYNIRVNSVNPTVVMTDMSAYYWGRPDVGPPFLEQMPLGRWATEDEIAAPISFLLSDDASMITGVSLPVDGGYSCCAGAARRVIRVRVGSLGIMIRRHRCAAAVLALLVAVLTGCAHAISGTATWPGAKLERAVLTAADFPPGVQYDRLIETPGQPDGAGGPPAMLSNPEGCSDGLTRVIADSAERGPGSAAEYVVGYDGARIVMTVLTWKLDLDRLAATAERCAHFQTFFDPSIAPAFR